MLRKFGMALAATLIMAGSALAEDAIVGDWKTEKGSIAGISSCGGAFCIKLKTGEHAGKSIGKFTASGGNKYSGSITGPADDKAYKGKATLSGNSLKMQGCVLGGLICRSQNWKRS